MVRHFLLARLGVLAPLPPSARRGPGSSGVEWAAAWPLCSTTRSLRRSICRESLSTTRSIASRMLAACARAASRVCCRWATASALNGGLHPASSSSCSRTSWRAMAWRSMRASLVSA